MNQKNEKLSEVKKEYLLDINDFEKKSNWVMVAMELFI